MLEHILLYPFVHADEIHGALLISETPYLGAHTDYLRIILAAVGEPTTDIIRDRRAEYARVLRQSIVSKPSEVTIIAERVVTKSTGAVTLLLVDLADVVSQIATANDHLDPFRIRQDVLRSVAALFATTATVCDADANRALLLLHGRTGDDTDLIVHHAAATLAHLLPEIADVPTLRYRSARYPQDDSDVGALINTLL